MNDQEIVFILTWLFYWLLSYWLFNFRLLKNGFSFRQKTSVTALFFFALIGGAWIFFQSLGFKTNIGVFWLATLTIPLAILSSFVSKHGLPLLTRIFSDIPYQQFMVNVAFLNLRTGNAGHDIITFCLLFTLSHTPIFLVKHVSFSGRLLIIAASAIGAPLLYFSLDSGGWGWLLAYFLHSGFYLGWFVFDDKSIVALGP